MAFSSPPSQLYLYNSLNKKKEIFNPITPNTVKMYVCGMTVYDYCHIGHARVMVVFDIINKWFKELGFKVIYVRNITDIDDKIINRAVKNNETISQLTSRFINAMHEDSDNLGIARPDIEPKATQYIKPMLNMITKLFNKNLAYISKDGDINFKVRGFNEYGKLSGKNIDELQSGHRDINNVSSNKQDDLDFVLWKSSKISEPDEVKWNSPWGQGRPGWHIECSAMSCELLGEEFDIHGGGMDLQFPHHENEIAQSEGANHYENNKPTGKKMANYWLHNGFVKVNNEKMSKSLGNFFTIREVFKHFHPEVIRFFILKAHYRSPLNYADSYLQEAKIALERIYTAIEKAKQITQPMYDTQINWSNIYAQRFAKAMNDDFNTASAVSILFELVSKVNKQDDITLALLLKNLSAILGIGQLENINTLSLNLNNNIDSRLIEEKISLRKLAKIEKRFNDADKIRNELVELGITLKDHSNGETTWQKD